MPNFGRETSGASVSNFELFMVGNPTTMPEDGDVESITAYLAESSTANAHNVKGILYDSSGNVLGETSARQDLTTTPGWITFTFSSPVAVSGSTAVVLAVAASSGTGNINCYQNTGASGDGRQAAMTGYPTIDDPTTFVNNALQLSIYATYTATGGGAVIPKFIYQYSRRRQ